MEKNIVAANVKEQESTKDWVNRSFKNTNVAVTEDQGKNDKVEDKGEESQQKQSNKGREKKS